MSDTDVLTAVMFSMASSLTERKLQHQIQPGCCYIGTPITYHISLLWS